MSKEQKQSSYYAILSYKLLTDNRLKPNEKLLFAHITTLSNQHGYCFASNRHFSKIFTDGSKDKDGKLLKGEKLDKKIENGKITISKWIKSLIEFGYLERVIIKDKDNNQVIERKLYPIIDTFGNSKSNTPINFESNTPTNSKSNTPINFKSNYNNTSDIIVQDNNKEKKETQILNYTELSKKPNAPILTKALAKFEQHFNLYGLSEQPKEIESVRSMLINIQTNLKAYNKRIGIFDKVSNAEVIEAFNLSIDNFMSKNPNNDKLTLAYFKGSLNPNIYNKHLISKFKQSNKANESNISIVQADLSDFKQIVTQTFKHYKNFAKNECKHIESMIQKLKTEFQKDNIVFEFDYIFKNLPAWIMKTTSYQSLSFIDKKFDELIRESDLRPENHIDYNVLKSSYGHNRAVEVIRLSKLQTT